MNKTEIRNQIKSIYSFPIQDINYKVKDCIRCITTCTIHWIDSCTGNLRKTEGVAICSPADIYDETIGKRLAESRAKIRMYREIQRSISNAYFNTKDKHSKLFYKELKHKRELIKAIRRNQLNNKDNE